MTSCARNIPCCRVFTELHLALPTRVWISSNTRRAEHFYTTYAAAYWSKTKVSAAGGLASVLSLPCGSPVPGTIQRTITHLCEHLNRKYFMMLNTHVIVVRLAYCRQQLLVAVGTVAREQGPAPGMLQVGTQYSLFRMLVTRKQC